MKIKIPAIKQLLKFVSSGVGAVAGTWIARWKAHAEADVKRIEAQGKADALLIEAESKGQAMKLITDAQLTAEKALNDSPIMINSEIDITDEIRSRITFQERKRQANIQSVVLDAAETLGEKEVEESEIDHDWTSRFFADVMDVSSAEMQQIWSNILAGEVESPGRTSLRTLSILKQMSQRDAHLFQRATKYVIRDFIHNDSKVTTEVLPDFPTYNEFMRLAHHGLFQLGLGLSKIFRGYSEYLLEDENTIYRIYKDRKGEYELVIPSHVLTESGSELYSVMNTPTNTDYLRFFAKFLNERGGWNLAYSTMPESGIISVTTTHWHTVEPTSTDTAERDDP